MFTSTREISTEAVGDIPPFNNVDILKEIVTYKMIERIFFFLLYLTIWYTQHLADFNNLIFFAK